jgi:glycerol-3-phosphate dehydrogenase
MEHPLQTEVLMIICGGATGTGLARHLPVHEIHCTFVEKEDINSGAFGGKHGLLHNRPKPLPLVVVI